MSYHHLTCEQRYTIFSLMQAGKTKIEICSVIGVSRSTLYRELKRNSIQEKYEFKQADELYRERRKCCHKCNVISPELREEIIKHLDMKWSPEQIAGRLVLEKKAKISCQTIYNMIAGDRRNGGQIYRKLRRKKKYRRRLTRETRGSIKNRRPITERPKEIESRERYGDWELDTMVSRKDKTTLVTAVERKSRYSVVMKVGSRNASSISRALCKYLKNLPCPVRTLTSDNGKEFAEHQRISKAFSCDFFFALPHHPWERGTNENTNGLLREYFPKGESFRAFTKTDIKKITEELNNRPRKCLHFLTPAELFFNNAIEFEEKESILETVQQECCI